MNFKKKMFLWGILGISIIFLSYYLIQFPHTSKHNTSKTIPLSFSRIEGLQIPFIKNLGQKSTNILYYSPLKIGTVFITKKGDIAYLLAEKGGIVERISEKFLLKPKIVAGVSSSTTVNYYYGKKAYTDLPSFKTIQLKSIQPGINLTLRAYQRKVEKIFEVKAGSNPQSILVKVNGVKKLRLNGKKLVLITKFGEFYQSPPNVFQIINGKKIHLKASYKLLNKDTYSFNISNYNHHHPIYIDPIMYSTYFGGGKKHCENEYELKCGTDGGGYLIIKNNSIYTVGYTYGDIPVATNAYSRTISGGKDIFVARLSLNLKKLITATYIGGREDEQPKAIGADTNGNIYIAGFTKSNDFPIKNGYDNSFNGKTDIFIAKFSPDLTTLLSSTYIGGTGSDIPYAIMVTKDVTIVGETDSPDYPTTTLSHNRGQYDAFVSKLSIDLSKLIASTIISGSKDDFATDVTTTGNRIVVVGGTFSNDLFNASRVHYGPKDGFLSILNYNFTVTYTAYAEIAKRDQFEKVAKYNDKLYIVGTGTRTGNARDIFLLYLDLKNSTFSSPIYYGGGNPEQATSMAISDTGIYIGGWTLSSDLPYTNNGFQNNARGEQDGFIVRYNFKTGKFDLATYLGGSNSEVIKSIAIDKKTGELYIGGTTKSYDFPVTSGFDDVNNGGGDLFVVGMSNLRTLDYGTFIGGGGREQLNKIIVTDNAVYVGGWSESYNLPATGADTTFNGDIDAIVAKLTKNLDHIIALTYIGGSGDDRLLNFRVYPDENKLYAIGKTTSRNFPVSSNAFQTYLSGNYDSFIVTLYSDSLTGLTSTYFGSPGTDKGFDILKIAGTNQILVLTDMPYGSFIRKFNSELTKEYGFITISNSSNVVALKMIQALNLPGEPVYVAGRTGSDLPYLNGYDTTYNGNTDGFIFKINPYTLSISDATLLGGSEFDSINAIKIVNTSSYGPLVYVGGETYSKDFTVTTGYPKASTENSDFFITAFTPDLKKVVISRIYGGSGEDKINTMTMLNNSILVAGKTNSPDLATIGAYDTTFNGYYDGFIARFPLDLSKPISISYLGGSSNDMIISSDYDGSLIYLTGKTYSGNFPVTAEALKPFKGGCADGFIAAFSPDYFTYPPLILSLGASPDSGNPPLDVTLHAEIKIAYDPDITGPSKIIWNCDNGNKVTETVNSTGITSLDHTCHYEKGGPYQPNIKLISYGNKVSQASTAIYINKPPVILSLTATPQPATAPVTITFKVNAEDPDGSITKYEWKVGDTGEWKETKIPEYIYKFNNEFSGNVYVKITDNDGATAESSIKLRIYATPSGKNVTGKSEKSSGCSCNMTGSNNWGDLLPFFLLSLIWLGIKRKEKAEAGD